MPSDAANLGFEMHSVALEKEKFSNAVGRSELKTGTKFTTKTRAPKQKNQSNGRSGTRYVCSPVNWSKSWVNTIQQLLAGFFYLDQDFLSVTSTRGDRNLFFGIRNPYIQHGIHGEAKPSHPGRFH
ncbi:MAG: hypothetical protein CM1200mP39_25290 [Dehalococcoidia bacterium]|nr:MAG: hypothetical protein CM1200mP39_25290 [Dehalococcoidia bacterium]